MIRRSEMRHRICSGCNEVWNESCHERIEKKYICPHCEHKKRRPGTAIPRAARKTYTP